MIVGYVMNTYPLVSTTFIGREIAALERLGLTVKRYAIRPWTGELVDPGDREEKAKTQYLLGDRARLIRSILGVTIRSPRRFVGALRLTLMLIKNARGRLVKHFAYLAEAAVLRGLAEQDGVTHLHAHFSTNSTTVAMLVRELGGPEFSFTVHGPDELLSPIENSTREKVARAKFVACISHFARSQVMLFSDQDDWRKLEIVHCGIVSSNYGRLPRGPYCKRILFIGRLAAAKGVPLLLEAVAEVKEGHPDLRLTIVGDGPDRLRLETQAADLGLSDSVEFLGFQSQAAVADILERVDLLVLPSFAEGVPVVLMEAMASRLPVITTRIAGIPELVEDGVSGLLVPPGDGRGLVASLETLLADRSLRETLGGQGRTKVEEEYSVSHSGEMLANLLSGTGGLDNTS